MNTNQNEYLGINICQNEYLGIDIYQNEYFEAKGNKDHANISLSRE